MSLCKLILPSGQSFGYTKGLGNGVPLATVSDITQERPKPRMANGTTATLNQSNAGLPPEAWRGPQEGTVELTVKNMTIEILRLQQLRVDAKDLGQRSLNDYTKRVVTSASLLAPVIEAMTDNDGQISRAAREMDCAASTIYRRRDKDEDIAEAIIDARESKRCWW